MKPTHIMNDPVFLRQQLGQLQAAGKALYYAGYWSCDREVDEAQLWEDFRDALGLLRGTSPKRKNHD